MTADHGALSTNDGDRYSFDANRVSVVPYKLQLARNVTVCAAMFVTPPWTLSDADTVASAIVIVIAHVLIVAVSVVRIILIVAVAVVSSKFITMTARRCFRREERDNVSPH